MIIIPIVVPFINDIVHIPKLLLNTSIAYLFNICIRYLINCHLIVIFVRGKLSLNSLIIYVMYYKRPLLMAVKLI